MKVGIVGRRPFLVQSGYEAVVGLKPQVKNITKSPTKIDLNARHLLLKETVEILEWVALLWILALAKARSAVPISAATSAKRATQANAKINATFEGTRQKGQLAASLVHSRRLRRCS